MEKIELLFIHDHKFRFINNRYYSTGGLSQAVLDRYYKVFGKFTIIARVVTEKTVGDNYSKVRILEKE
ncbi:TPA: hypothetical protein ACGOYS_002000 [Streptococcus suis]